MVQIGTFIINDEMLILIIALASYLSYFIIKKLSPVEKTEVLYIDPKFPQGRRFKGEYSMLENRVSLYKPTGFRKKPERLDFGYEEPPLIEFKGATKHTVFKVYYGSGKTSSWLETEEESGSKDPQTTHSNIGKFERLAAVLAAASIQSGKQQLMNILLGIPIGALVMLVITKLVPGLA